MSVKKYYWVVEIILEAHLNALVKNWISSECPFNLRLLITPELVFATVWNVI